MSEAHSMEGPDPSPAPARVLLEEDMGQAERCACGAGQVVLISRRSPFAEGANEDGAALLPLAGDRLLLAVADGAGGHASGGEAARIALERLSAAAHASPDGNLRDSVLDGFEQADRAVGALAGGAATTLVAAAVEDRSVRVYHVGDSTALVVGQRGRIKLQTISHSPTGYAVEAGLLGEEEALVHEDRHLILNALGCGDMRVEMSSPLRLAPRDTLLLASDGLWDNLSPEEIVERIRKGDLLEGIQRLADAARRRMGSPDTDRPSKPDDLTVLAFRPEPGRGREGPNR